MMVEIEYHKDDYVKCVPTDGKLHPEVYQRRKLSLVIIADSDDVLNLNAIFFKDGWGFASASSSLSKRTLLNCMEDE